MIIGDACSALGLIYILWQIQFGSFRIIPILAGVAFNAIFVALLEPSYRATVTDLLTEEELDFMATLRPGLIQLEIGVQSTCPETLKEIRRYVSFEKLSEETR